MQTEMYTQKKQTKVDLNVSAAISKEKKEKKSLSKKNLREFFSVSSVSKSSCHSISFGPGFDCTVATPSLVAFLAILL